MRSGATPCPGARKLPVPNTLVIDRVIGLRLGVCRECGRRVALTMTGTVKWHRAAEI